MMGQCVPYVKDDVSPAFHRRLCENWRMAIDWLTEKEFNERLCARIARLREERGWTQAQMAAALIVPFERYKKYETRSPMPGYLIPRFAQHVDRDVAYILTGKVAEPGRRAARELRYSETSG